VRRFVCVMAALCMLVCLCACGREAAPEETSAETTIEITAAAAEIMTAQALPTTLPVNLEDENDIDWARAKFKEHYEEPDRIEPFQNVITKRIHENMPQFTFTVYGFIGRDGEREHHMAYAIDISEQNGTYHQRLDGFSTIYPSKQDARLVDFNNDGYLDIQLHLWQGGSMRNEPSLFWLWDNRKHEFVENEQLRMLSDEASVDVEDNGRITCYTRVMGGEYNLAYYSYI